VAFTASPTVSSGPAAACCFLATITVGWLAPVFVSTNRLAGGASQDAFLRCARESMCPEPQHLKSIRSAIRSPETVRTQRNSRATALPVAGFVFSVLRASTYGTESGKKVPLGRKVFGSCHLCAAIESPWAGNVACWWKSVNTLKPGVCPFRNMPVRLNRASNYFPDLHTVPLRRIRRILRRLSRPKQISNLRNYVNRGDLGNVKYLGGFLGYHRGSTTT